MLFICLLALAGLASYNSNAQTKNLKKPVPPYQSKKSLHSDSTKTFTETDSILSWKQNRQFAYMKYLDSFLRNRKKLRTDTLSVNGSTEKMIRKIPAERPPSSVNDVMNSLPLRIFFWALAFIFIAFISYKVFLKNPVFTFRKKKAFIQNNEEGFQEQKEILEYDALIAEAENKNELNLAVRYLFLKTLKILTDKGFIDYASEKTNQEYLREMQKNNYFSNFKKITRNYEYSWYGKFILSEKDYENIKREFNFFIEKV